MMKMSNFRWKVAWLIFIVSFVSYMDRVNLSVATPVIMKEYGFDKIDMGLIQSFFFAGYALMQVPGGMMAEKFGHRITGSLAVIWWSVFTALTAVAKGKFSFAAVRFLFGMGEGPIYPAFAIAIFRWFFGASNRAGFDCCIDVYSWLENGFFDFWHCGDLNGLGMA